MVVSHPTGARSISMAMIGSLIWAKIRCEVSVLYLSGGFHMRPRSVLVTLLILAWLVLGASGQVAADPGGPHTPAATLGTGFTYQGQLVSGGAPVSGACDMAFRLYDDALAGVQVGGTITTPVTVTSG